MRKIIIICFLTMSGCAQLPPEPYEPSSGHIQAGQPIPESDIPPLVQQIPVVPEPEPAKELEKYTVVVNEVPVKELLFALARDAQINVDIDPGIEGVVTINAVEQTLSQLLHRISRQVSLRYEFKEDVLIISTDSPFLRSYQVNYLNMARETNSTVTIATQIASTGGGGESGGGSSGGGGGNNSTTDITSVSNNNFWASLVANVLAILGEETEGGGEIEITNTVIPNPETGILTVKATSQQHEVIQTYIDNAVASAHRQVLVQATIVEVSLNDDYQAGIDWSFINQAGKAGFDFVSTSLTGAPVNTASSFLLRYTDPNPNREQVLSGTLRLLEEFGDISVLSSPQIMALNNQTAILKVVDNVVYFTVEQETNTTQGVVTTTFESNVHTVPVGIVMNITPQINENDSIILNVRPTISRISSFVNDPNPSLTVANPVPEIQVREMESILRMNNGQIAVLGGLMQDESNYLDTAIPGLSRIPGVGEAFKTRTRAHKKTELVIFLRPVVVRNPSLDGDLQMYKPLLKAKSGE
jgi:MSHA biogenesis protein MshL